MADLCEINTKQSRTEITFLDPFTQSFKVHIILRNSIHFLHTFLSYNTKLDLQIKTNIFTSDRQGKFNEAERPRSYEIKELNLKMMVHRSKGATRNRDHIFQQISRSLFFHFPQKIYRKESFCLSYALSSFVCL